MKKMIKKIILLLVIFLIIAGFLIVKGSGYDLKDKEDRKAFAKAYFSWTSNVVSNIADLTANAIKMDWLPKS